MANITRPILWALMALFILACSSAHAQNRSNDVNRVIDWVRSEGHPSNFYALTAKLMGIPIRDPKAADIPAIEKAYRVKADSGAIYTFLLVPTEHGDVPVVARRSEVEFKIWRIDERGEPVVTVVAEGAIHVAPNDKHLESCRKTVEYFVRRVKGIGME